MSAEYYKRQLFKDITLFVSCKLPTIVRDNSFKFTDVLFWISRNASTTVSACLSDNFQTICFSRSVEIHEKIIGAFIRQINRRKPFN
ncbi:hypothetical protein CE195_01310 [Sodalis-like symbiont of Philaenus spumarius]|nr:hypothetical protein CE195_01310 [Sodalis-like symbiont of Philaenus spumarius]